ncbi:MAG: Protein of unknown function (DUF1553)/Protein of unknown function (DUF1549)/Planctomycete [Planctomycetota bacterium]|nr:Protein of unknown function (DUF1553)/Protein of unknown function (DUF1549)/Planctomycete [Planctomycetota bacterium]
MGRMVLAAMAVASLLLGDCRAGDDAGRADAARAEFFEARVRPVLVGRCFECHGPNKQKGGLRLDSPDAMRTGGDTGPVIVAGDPEHSPLIEAIRHDGSVKMPPKGKLDAAEIDVLTEWVKQGASWPSTTSEKRPETAASFITDADRAFWAFQPVKEPPAPVVKDTAWPKSSLDAFILAKLEQNGLRPSPPAAKRTLIRRATFDLIGLPPTPEESEAFVNDASPEAFARVVDRLLASPHYGERWGRHWLDVARYGEDQAHSFQPRLYPNGFRYRDWVARAFNADMPYDRFVTEQIAGDLLDEPGRLERLPALGFFALGPVYYGDPKTLDQVDDRIDTMTRGFLGLTVACARCHDHKFDPIPTADYYALAGVFLSTNYHEAPDAPPEQIAAFDLGQLVIEAKTREIDAFLQGESSRAHAAESARVLVAALAHRGEPRRPLADLARIEGLDADRLGRWVGFLDRAKDHAEVIALRRIGDDLAEDDEARRILLDAAETFLSRVQALLDRRQALLAAESLKKSPSPPALDAADKALIGWLFDDKGPLAVRKDQDEKELPATAKRQLAALREAKNLAQKNAPPKYPVVHTLKDHPRPADTTVLVRGNAEAPGPTVPRHFLSILGGDSAPFTRGSGRLELARAIARPDNPLTARVMVNRIWQHHFGRGLVGTPSNFGELGERPSHPELLDHLARRFVANGWSIKSIHRDILLSATYQQAGGTDSHAIERDPENRLLWRMKRRRLEVEAWRDAILAVSGRLDPALGGPSVKLDDRNNRRRTFYAAVSRHDLSPMLRLFDFPDPNITGSERTRTTVPLQALIVMNDEFLIESARALAARVRSSPDGGDDARIQMTYALLFGRPATDRERQIGREYLSAGDPDGSPPADLSRWERYAQALLGTNEFVFVD